MKEFELIESLFSQQAGQAGLGLQDDAACWQPPPDHDIILSVDMLVAGVHFPVGASPALVAARLVGCALSDLAAKGAKPEGCLLTLAFGGAFGGAFGQWDELFLQDFAAAFHKECTRHNVSLWGGDSVSAPTPSVSLSVYGVVPHGTMIKRSGANVGDDVYVSGVIGGGIVGLQEALKDIKSSTKTYSNPEPRLALGQHLRDLASASIDISDGLLADVGHICKASDVAIDMECNAIPLINNTLNDALTFDDMITGGDDYELAFTANPTHRTAIASLAKTLSLPLTRIGIVKEKGATGESLTLITAEGKPHPLPKKRGFSHI
ncbi:MAG: thiamine-phosphate kinase [Alphaproteobacteria bacterium]|nr:thiamine-phosphate kinase [Alphaproteobacteria bacterium]